jgi:hypothetical protein
MNVAIRMQLGNLPGDTQGAIGGVLATFTLACLFQWESVYQDQFELSGMMPRTNRGRLVLAALENLHHAFLHLGSTELVFQRGLAGVVENTLGSMADAGNGMLATRHQTII